MQCLCATRVQRVANGRYGRIHVPETFVVPDVTGHSTPNGAAVILQPDGRTLVQMNPVCRNTSGGDGKAPIFGDATHGEPQHFEDLYGMGQTGAYGGSGLSALGGRWAPTSNLFISPSHPSARSPTCEPKPGCASEAHSLVTWLLRNHSLDHEAVVVCALCQPPTTPPHMLTTLQPPFHSSTQLATKHPTG